MSGILADHVGLGRQPAQVNWTPAFVGLLVYVFVIMTYRLPIGTVVMAGALVSLLLQRQSLRVPLFLWLFAKRLALQQQADQRDRESTRLNSSHLVISYAVFCLKKKKNNEQMQQQRKRYSP